MYLTRLYNRIILKKVDFFYWQFFTQNPIWSKKELNEDEKLRWKIIQDFILKIEPDSICNILDLGSGRGWLTNKLNSYGHAMGLEPVRVVVKHAKKLYTKIDFRFGTIVDLLREGRTFDLVVTSEVIEHIPHKSQADFIINISKILQPQGLLILTTPRKEAVLLNNGSRQPIEDVLFEEEVNHLIENNNFEIILRKNFSPHLYQITEHIYQAILAKTTN